MAAIFNRSVLAIIGLQLVLAEAAIGAVAVGPITDINNGGVAFGNAINVYANPPIFVDETAIDGTNDIVVYTMNGPSAGTGGGFAFGISNGENGITSSEGGLNTDNNNVEPPHPVFAAIGNPGGKLANGNAIRLSAWMRQDPADPATAEPSVEPVLKIELWKEALSGTADFSNTPTPGSGDRVWDTDQNAQSFPDQSQASWIDANNNGSLFYGQPVHKSLVPNEWRLVQTTLVIDDDPFGDGTNWLLAAEPYTVADIEEIRAVMFVGDFAGTDLTAGGSFWVDNLMLEVFATEAAMLATPNPNPHPDTVTETADFNNDGRVDGADFLAWQRGAGLTTGATLAQGDANGNGAVNEADLAIWEASFGDAAALGASSPVPEPASILLATLAAAGMLEAARKRRPVR